ncbi:MAG: hypothetical protein R3C53_05180 [Pirellulaceae bacterium]
MNSSFQLALAACAISSISSLGFAQSHQPTRGSNSPQATGLSSVTRHFGGWAASPPAPNPARPISGLVAAVDYEEQRDQVEQVLGSGEAPVVQRAFYQAQNSLSDSMPTLSMPNQNGQAAGGTFPNNTPPVIPDLPTSSGIPAPATNTVLPSAQPNLLSNGQPPQSPIQTRPLRTDSPQNYAAGNTTAPDVLPPLHDSYTTTPERQNIPASPVAYTQNGSDLRAIRGTQQAAPNGQDGRVGADGREITTGYPFVSPPPSNTGRYPTSPYIGPRYQTTAFQRTTNVQAQTVAAQTGINAPAGVDPADVRPSLPQNQPVTGIYPTAFQQCAPYQNYPPTGTVPGAYVPPTYTPNLTPGFYSNNNSGYSPLFSLGQENYNVLLGRGIIGQPTVYVPGQPFRNFFRYISP